MASKHLNWISGITLSVLLVACGGGNSTGSKARTTVRPVTWIDNAWTQPVPAWGSPVRLNLPVPLESIVFGPGGGFGAFGAHAGGNNGLGE